MEKFIYLVLFLIVKSVYLPLNKRKSKYYWKLKIDDSIPFLPVFIIPYISYFPYIIVTIISIWNTRYVYEFFASYIISYVVAGIFWYLVPNGVKRPTITGKDVFSRMTAYIFKHDDDTNGFPSAHVFATLICSYFLFLAFPAYFLFVLFMACAIIASTVLVKQHYVIDILGGILVFFVSVFLMKFLLL
ncbi:MAG: phosphatase PAP2 family protein [Microgenomates group bacterium]